ncbi:MAG: type II toxin-antitoxin system RelB/DinJ family antitoxin [Chordicoccus sp.]|jgi:addiction module RelB/DinJ family antitoxin
MASTYIQIRTDERDKKEASEILSALGTNLSAVLNMTIKQIILQRRIPFDVALPKENAISKSVRSVAASMAIEGLSLNDAKLNDLEHFSQKSSSEQIQEIKNLVNRYSEKGTSNG